MPDPTPLYGLWNDDLGWLHDAIAVVVHENKEQLTQAWGGYGYRVVPLVPAGTELRALWQWVVDNEPNDSQILNRAS